jgi:hypothetical protein
MPTRERWSRIAILAGCVTTLVGALDPMEGSILIFIGSGLIALGTGLDQEARRRVAYWAWSFVLIAVGVSALWALSALGGIGGSSGRSMWWGLVVVPYLVGWLMTVWGAGLPRWFSLLGVVVGLWYLAIPGMLLLRGTSRGHASVGVAIGLGVVGLLTIAGCIRRLLVRAAVAEA